MILEHLPNNILTLPNFHVLEPPFTCQQENQWKFDQSNDSIYAH